MSNTDEVRWQQRLEHFSKAMGQLESACDLEEYSDLERAGLVQVFEFSFELAWKTLKDLLFYEGHDVKSPRDVLRKAFEVEYLNEDDGETLLDALDKRNILSHTYDEERAQQAVALIRDEYSPALVRLRNTLQGKRKS
jgi:nucleotidyltransferase substrate binding protein (TIGR01987 family)